MVLGVALYADLDRLECFNGAAAMQAQIQLDAFIQ